MISKKYRNIVFDLDGTLLDTIKDLQIALNITLKNNNLPTRTLEEVTSFIGNGVRVLVAKAVEGGESHPLFEQILSQYRTYYKEHSIEHTVFYPGVEEFLKLCKGKSIGMAVVTNKPREGCELIHRHFFTDYMQTVIGVTNDSEKKPCPVNVLKAMDILKATPKDTLYVGDSEVDAQTAKNAGLDCVLCTWGYTPLDILLHEPHIAIINSPKELAEFI